MYISTLQTVRGVHARMAYHFVVIRMLYM